MSDLINAIGIAFLFTFFGISLYSKFAKETESQSELIIDADKYNKDSLYTGLISSGIIIIMAVIIWI